MKQWTMRDVRKPMGLALAGVALASAPALVFAAQPDDASHPVPAETAISNATHRPAPRATAFAHAKAESVGASQHRALAPKARAVAKVSARGPRTVVVNVVAVTSNFEDAQAAVNRCVGPVEVLWSRWGYPNDIVQHNYCGGAWFASLATGTRVRIVGGTQPGLYRVNGERRTSAKNATIAVTAGIGDLELQTCVGNRIAYIGLSRI